MELMAIRDDGTNILILRSIILNILRVNYGYDRFQFDVQGEGKGYVYCKRNAIIEENIRKVKDLFGDDIVLTLRGYKKGRSGEDIYIGIEIGEEVDLDVMVGVLRVYNLLDNETLHLYQG